jgi:polyisoprenyl-teichoic acid--peptidoglycan teichoic acid transferase
LSSKPEAEPVDVPDRAARVRYRRAMTLVLMTLVIPGSAQLVTGNRKVARIAMRTWMVLVVLVVLAVLTAVLAPRAVLWFGTRSLLLLVLRLALFVLAVGWAYLFVDAWRLGEPLSLSRNHRLAVVGTNVVMVVGVLAVLLFGAHVVGVQRDFLEAVGGSGKKQDSVEGRYNVLLVGADSGADRWGMRPDSLTVASIDANTGKTVLIGLPRNMSNFPFPQDSVLGEQFPDGWNCDDCMLNSVSTWAYDHEDLFKDTEHVGMEATVQAVEGITDLDISYWAMVNLKGFSKLVDAFGGVELNVRDRIPVGLPQDSYFHYI